jgi:hypothetical protein
MSLPVDGYMTLDSGLRRNDLPGIMICPNIFEHRLLEIVLRLVFKLWEYRPFRAWELFQRGCKQKGNSVVVEVVKGSISQWMAGAEEGRG